MKTSILFVIGIVSGFIVLVALAIFVVPTMETNHQKECHHDGGKVTGFLQCTRIHMDYSLEPTTVFINLGALDPQSKNPISPKEMTVVLGKNNTVTWLNRDGPSHFINFESWSIGPIHQGERQSVTFNQTGMYEYFSVDSPSISGSVTVKSDLGKNDLKDYAVSLSEINRQAIIHQKNNNEEEFEKQLILMKEKQTEIASRIFGLEISDAYIVKDWNFPLRDASEIKSMAGTKPIITCNIPEKIPVHLQHIQQSEMFQRFAGKYSQHQLVVDISDERYSGGLIHYDLIATSDDGLFTARTYFHLDSCTDEMKWPYFLLCKDLISEEHISTSIKSEIISSLESDEFCNIEFEPWHQELRVYQTKISKEIDSLTQGDVPIDSQGNASYRYFLEVQRLGLLNDIIRYYESENSDHEKMQEDVAEYNRKFGSLPEELLEIIEKRK